ncbi:MAG TPA: hypothetical protein VJN93_02605 [Candidatus Acidoferrum sp.]|nr:hypothetical protein [Candidatus Acidoferrum sp.]
MPGLLTRPRAERRARREGTRAHSKVRRQRRGNGAKEIAAAGAAAVLRDGASGIGAQPVSASFTNGIDALHGVAGQILHIVSLSARLL